MLSLRYSQKLGLSLAESWNFFSAPENLKVLTPEHLRFEIAPNHTQRPLYAGQIIAYTIRPLFNFPIEWITEITHAEEPHYFIDEQRFGPYKFWHHEHRFNSIEGGVEMIDLVHYKMPFGICGTALHHFKVRKDLEAIFAFRHAKLESLFKPNLRP